METAVFYINTQTVNLPYILLSELLEVSETQDTTCRIRTYDDMVKFFMPAPCLQKAKEHLGFDDDAAMCEYLF